MKKTLLIVLSLVLLLINITSCKQSSEILISDKIKVVNGDYYFSYEITGNNDTLNSDIAQEVQLSFRFSSIEEMVIKLRSADFTEAEFVKMEKQFPKDTNGIIIPDLDTIQEPSFIPEDFIIGCIIWSGGKDYAIAFGIEEEKNLSTYRNILMIIYGDEASFQNSKNGNKSGVTSTDSLDNFIKSKVSSCKNFTENSVMRGVTEGKVFEYENKDGYKGKAVRWDFEFQGRKYFIQENYEYDYLYEKYSGELGFELNLEYPNETVVFVEDENNYFSIRLHYSNVEMTKDFITQFGLRKFD
ncbi:MAG: hypothetical protein WC102_07155 [Saccharofermentanales bacterium]